MALLLWMHWFHGWYCGFIEMMSLCKLHFISYKILENADQKNNLIGLNNFIIRNYRFPFCIHVCHTIESHSLLLFDLLNSACCSCCSQAPLIHCFRCFCAVFFLLVHPLISHVKQTLLFRYFSMILGTIELTQSKIILITIVLCVVLMSVFYKTMSQSKSILSASLFYQMTTFWQSGPPACWF